MVQDFGPSTLSRVYWSKLHIQISRVLRIRRGMRYPIRSKQFRQHKMYKLRIDPAIFLPKWIAGLTRLHGDLASVVRCNGRLWAFSSTSFVSFAGESPKMGIGPGPKINHAQNHQEKTDIGIFLSWLSLDNQIILNWYQDSNLYRCLWCVSW